MNFRFALTSFVLLTAVALIVFGLSQPINAALGVTDSIASHFWNLEALAVAFAIVAGYAYPHVRGVRQGDMVVAVFPVVHRGGGAAVAMMNSGFARAASTARRGGKIRIELDGGRQAEGVVVEYAGTLSPAVVNVVETEVV